MSQEDFLDNVDVSQLSEPKIVSETNEVTVTVEMYQKYFNKKRFGEMLTIHPSIDRVSSVEVLSDDMYVKKTQNDFIRFDITLSHSFINLRDIVIFIELLYKMTIASQHRYVMQLSTSYLILNDSGTETIEDICVLYDFLKSNNISYREKVDNYNYIEKTLERLCGHFGVECSDNEMAYTIGLISRREFRSIMGMTILGLAQQFCVYSDPAEFITSIMPTADKAYGEPNGNILAIDFNMLKTMLTEDFHGNVNIFLNISPDIAVEPRFKNSLDETIMISKPHFLVNIKDIESETREEYKIAYKKLFHLKYVEKIYEENCYYTTSEEYMCCVGDNEKPLIMKNPGYSSCSILIISFKPLYSKEKDLFYIPSLVFFGDADILKFYISKLLYNFKGHPSLITMRREWTKVI